MTLYEYVAAKIRELRTSFGGPNGISQEALAEKLEVATNTISRWETGAYKPSLEDLEKLSRFFGKSILEFFPKENTSSDDRLSGLLRAARNLPNEDVEEVRRYAEFRQARTLLKDGAKPRPGRKRKSDAEP